MFKSRTLKKGEEFDRKCKKWDVLVWAVPSTLCKWGKPGCPGELESAGSWQLPP